MARSPRSISPSVGCLPFQLLPTTKAISKHYPAASTSSRPRISKHPTVLPAATFSTASSHSISFSPCALFSIGRATRHPSVAFFSAVPAPIPATASPAPPAPTPPAKLSATSDDFLLPCGSVASLHPFQLRRVMNDRHRSHQTENPPTTGRIPLPRRPSQICRPLQPRSVLTPRRRPDELDEKMGWRFPCLPQIRQTRASPTSTTANILTSVLV